LASQSREQARGLPDSLIPFISVRLRFLPLKRRLPFFPFFHAFGDLRCGFKRSSIRAGGWRLSLPFFSFSVGIVFTFLPPGSSVRRLRFSFYQVLCDYLSSFLFSFSGGLLFHIPFLRRTPEFLPFDFDAVFRFEAPRRPDSQEARLSPLCRSLCRRHFPLSGFFTPFSLDSLFLLGFRP